MHDLVFYYPEGHQAHAETGHPERPERIEAIRQALEEVGWWDRYPHLDPLELAEGVLGAIHTPAFLRRLAETCRQGFYFDADTYTTPASWQLALNAAGGAAATAVAVWSGQARRGFALTRPPGHHATPERAMGFCLLNNVALAAERLIQGEGAERLAIVDLDLHHGNGTQEIFYQRGEVFYLSTHQWPHYPGTGSLEETGLGPGRGLTANFPLHPFSGDRAFLTILDELILPLLDRYAPQMILVSYGFDAHWRDPLGNLRLSASAYGELVAGLAAWADRNCAGRIALFLEGGYDLEAARACSLAVTAALLGLPASTSPEAAADRSPHPEGMAWQGMVQRAKELWRL